MDAVFSHCYVDDCLRAMPIIDDAIDLSNQLKSLLKQGGLNLALELQGSDAGNSQR